VKYYESHSRHRREHAAGAPAQVTKGLKPTILAKLEQLNPGGSVKDRIGLT